jgi:hypothetical protein
VSARPAIAAWADGLKLIACGSREAASSVASSATQIRPQLRHPPPVPPGTPGADAGQP